MPLEETHNVEDTPNISQFILTYLELLINCYHFNKSSHHSESLPTILEGVKLAFSQMASILQL